MRWVEEVASWVEAAGVGVIVVGSVLATVAFLRSVAARKPFDATYRQYRGDLGRAILLGLELLVAGDIIATILVEPTPRSVGVLAIVVLIRTFLSFSLETEIEGTPPWRRREERAD